jgi:5-methylcytosine-specific restriction enzyme subunit McrC
MNRNNVISVFEHSRLNIGEQGFDAGHFESLVKYNDLHQGKYFNVGYNKVTFKSYVGLIQVGNKTIEILPKADRNSDENNVSKWQRALLYMLCKAGYIKINETSSALQHTQNANLLDVYLRAFLQETEQLIHKGLVKKYKKAQANLSVLKGRLLIGKQLQHNLLHKERFFTEHTSYTRDNLYNRILKSALDIVADISFKSDIVHDAKRLLLYFEDVEPWKQDISDFGKLQLDRKTFVYKDALVLAEMIILNYCPSFKSGQQQVLALLFDMNVLFEKFIYKTLKEMESEFGENDLSVTAQNSQLFWAHKTIRPDILVTFKKGEAIRSVIIDTKWKIVDEDYPSDRDLQQMFTYNIQFNSNHAILLYPSTGQNNVGKKAYSISKGAKDFTHYCEMYFFKMFDLPDTKMTKATAVELLEHIINN